jgi:hypothetical protein
MVWVDPRDVVTRPCARCALPWNASFMTIPFEVGISRKHQIGSSCRSNRPPSAFGPGVSPLKALSHACIQLCGAISLRPAGRRPGVVLSLGRQLACSRRISAGYSPGGYPPPMQSMPYRDPNAGVTRRNTSHNRHARGWPTGATRGRPFRKAVPIIPASHGRMLLSVRSVRSQALVGAVSGQAPPESTTVWTAIVSAWRRRRSGVSRGDSRRLCGGRGGRSGQRSWLGPPAVVFAAAAGPVLARESFAVTRESAEVAASAGNNGVGVFGAADSGVSCPRPASGIVSGDLNVAAAQNNRQIQPWCSWSIGSPGPTKRWR